MLDNSNLDYGATTDYTLGMTVSDGTHTSAVENAGAGDFAPAGSLKRGKADAVDIDLPNRAARNIKT